jgi:hypothetical protein
MSSSRANENALEKNLEQGKSQSETIKSKGKRDSYNGKRRPKEKVKGKRGVKDQISEIKVFTNLETAP